MSCRGSYARKELNSWRDWVYENYLEDALTRTDIEDMGDHPDPLIRNAFWVIGSLGSIRDAMLEENVEDASYYAMRLGHYWGELCAHQKQLEMSSLVNENTKDMKLADLLPKIEAAERQRYEQTLEAVERQQRGLRDENEKTKAISKDRAAKAKELKSEGWTHAAIASELEISERTVSRYINAKK